MHVTLFNMKERNFFLSLDFFWWDTHAYKSSSRKTSFIINAEIEHVYFVFYWNDDDCMQITRVHTRHMLALLSYMQIQIYSCSTDWRATLIYSYVSCWISGKQKTCNHNQLVERSKSRKRATEQKMFLQ